MKKVVLASMIVMALGLTTVVGAGHVWSGGKSVVSLVDMDDKSLEKLFSGYSEDLILECPEGIELPFRFNLGGDFLSVESAEESVQTVKVLKTFYVKSFGGELLFSANLVEWQEFGDFFKGSVGASVGHYDGRQNIGLSIELNQRQ